MTANLTLRNGALRLQVAPALGGAIVRFDALAPGPDRDERPYPIFRPTPPAATVDTPFEPNRFAFYPLVPWVSRLCPPVLPTATGPLTIPPNRPGETYPIHGYGAYTAWRVASQDATTLRLVLDHDGPPPFSAGLDYALAETSLTITLQVVNRLDRPVGLGLGFHPWLPRHEGGRLMAPARSVWMSGADKIPIRAEGPPDDWDFATERALPGRDVDHGFSGWTGTARYRWPAEDGVRTLEIESDCDEYILYAPAGADFFCFEPTSHKPSPGQTGGLDGLVMVEPGGTLRRFARFGFSLAPPRPPA